jgi:hypothetical protein
MTQNQDCQIFLGTRYQNMEKYRYVPKTSTLPKSSKMYQMAENIPSGQNICLNIPFQGHKLYPNWDIVKKMYHLATLTQFKL